MMVGSRIFAGIILLIGSVYDMKSLELPLWILKVASCGCILSMAYMLLWENCSWWEVIGGLVPGVISLLLSFVLKEQLGYGDGLILLFLGGSLGFKTVLGIWISGLFGSFVVSVILLISRRGTKRTQLPFVPFLLLGYLIMVIGGTGT